MPFIEFVCTGCGLVTFSSFDLTDRPHLSCSSGIGSWIETEPDDGYEQCSVCHQIAFRNGVCENCGYGENAQGENP